MSRSSSPASPTVTAAGTTNTAIYEDPTTTTPSPPAFKPFFTLISSTTQTTSTPSSTAPQTYHHPHTHYIFSDDDPSTLTSALLHSLSQNPSSSSPTSTDDASPTRASHVPHYPPNERLLLVDLAADGTSVTSARSLSSSYMVKRASVGAAPTFGGAGAGLKEEEEEGEAGLMLRIEGVDEVGSGLKGGEAIEGGGVEEHLNTQARLELLQKKYLEGMERLKALGAGGEGLE